MSNTLPLSSADTGVAASGGNPTMHSANGSPVAPGSASAPVTVAHTWVIVVGALALIWVLGFVFKGYRQ